MRLLNFISIAFAGLLFLGGCEKPAQTTNKIPRSGSADQNSAAAFSWDGANDKTDKYWMFH